MKKSFKEESLDKLVKQAVDIIDELADRGVNFFQHVIDTYHKMRVRQEKIKNIARSIKKIKRGKNDIRGKKS